MHDVFYAGVLGFPIKHSLSPVIFKHLSSKMKIPVAYQKLEVAPDTLEATVKVFRNTGVLSGWNVTIPHKKEMARWIDELSSESQVTQAVNVVKREGEKLLGYNTDVIGVIKTLKEKKVPISGKTAAIFGAGGAATAATYALCSENIKKLWIFCRDVEKTKKNFSKLEKAFPKTQFLWGFADQVSQITDPMDLYINATPLGMKGFLKPVPFPSGLVKNGFAFDVVYNPLETPFLQKAKKLGFVPIDGLDMLIWQAIAAWEIWIGPVPNIAKQKKSIRKLLFKMLTE